MVLPTTSISEAEVGVEDAITSPVIDDDDEEEDDEEEDDDDDDSDDDAFSVLTGGKVSYNRIMIDDR